MGKEKNGKYVYSDGLDVDDENNHIHVWTIVD